MSVINKLCQKNIIAMPYTFCEVPDYEVIMGSIAYNVAQDSSDIDIHAICTPDRSMLFSGAQGYIHGFDPPQENFQTVQRHGISANNKHYDITVHSIVRAFKLAADNNPNILDMLWVPQHCVVSTTPVGDHIRRNRKLFLNKNAYHRFRGYAFSQAKKLTASPRLDLIAKFGYDTKHAYHMIRLSEQCRQILEEGDMDITRSAELLKAIRRGEWSLDRVRAYFVDREKVLEQLYKTSTLRYSPDMNVLRNLLVECIEMKHGSLHMESEPRTSRAITKLEQIRAILEQY